MTSFCSDIVRFIWGMCKTFMIYNKKDKKLGLKLPVMVIFVCNNIGAAIPLTACQVCGSGAWTDGNLILFAIPWWVRLTRSRGSNTTIRVWRVLALTQNKCHGALATAPVADR